ncbi:MAG: PAS domain S-box protein [Spirochaetota bacterium]
MVWLIDLIDKNQKIYGVLLTALYAAVLLYSWIDYELIVQGSIFFLIPIILFSFLGMKTGLIIAGVNVADLWAATYFHGFSGISQHPFVWHFGGALVSIAVAYSFGTIKSLYTKEKRAERIIEKSKAQYQKVVDNIKEGMIILDPEAKVTFMNKAGADMLGIEVRNTGVCVLDLLDEENRRVFESEMRKRAKGRPSEYHIYFAHPTRGRRHLFVAASPYVDENGVMTGSIGFVNDITDTDKQKSKIQSLQRRNEYLIAEMHHRIGNSLSVVKAFLNLYLTDDSVEKADGLKKVEDIINTMAFINNKFFMNFDRQTLNIGRLVREAVIDLAEKYCFDMQKVKVDADNREEHIDVALPLGMLLTIFLSSLMGRVDATDCELSIRLRSRKGSAELMVAGNKANIFHSDCIAEELGNEGEIIRALLDQMGGECKAVGKKNSAIAIEF